MMRRFKAFSLFLICAAVLGVMLPAHAQDNRFPITITDATGNKVTITSDEAIVSGSGDVTEILVALGFRDKLVGIDTSSTYPPELLDEIPAVGFGRRLALEPIVEQAPTVFFCTQTCGPDSVLEQLHELNIPVVIIPDNEFGGLELPFQKIEMVAAALGVPEAGDQLAERVNREIDWVKTALANADKAPTVFHPYLRGQGLQLVAGDGTPAHFMITGAGGYNSAIDAGISGYTPLSAEIIFAAFPDYLVLTEGNVEASGGLDNILDQQGLRDTPAVQNNNIIVMDTQLLLGMSIRTGQALMFLAHQFHPELTWELEVIYPYSYADATGTEVSVQAPDQVWATDEVLLDTVRNLGFHAEMFSDIDLVEDSDLIVSTTQVEGIWQPLRDAGKKVIVLNGSPTIDEVAQALNVPGRGLALEARLANE